MKKKYIIAVALASVMASSCVKTNTNTDDAAKAELNADSIAAHIKKYSETELFPGEAFIDVYVKPGEKPEGVYNVKRLFWVSFVNKDTPEYHGQKFLNQEDSNLDENGHLINRPVRHYMVRLGKDECVLKTYANQVITNERKIYIHYIYE